MAVLIRGGISMDFKELLRENKTVIYKESKTELINTDWDLWGKRITNNEEVFVYRKIVTLEEAEQYELEKGILS